MPYAKNLSVGLPAVGSLWQREIDGYVIDLSWSSDGSVLAAAAADGPVTVHEARSGQPLRHWAGHAGGTMAIAWNRDGQRLASAGQDGHARFWASVTGQEVAALAAGSAWVEALAFHPTAEVFVTAAGQVLRFWSTTGERLGQAVPHTSTITDLTWHPSGDRLATAAYGGVNIWPARPAGPPDQPISPLRRYDWKGSILKLAWAPNGFALAATSQDKSVRFWFTDSGRDLEMTGYPDKIRALAWDATSRYLATAGSPTVTIWDCSGQGPANTKPVQLGGHDHPVSALAYAHRGAMLAAGSLDGWVSLWPASRSGQKARKVSFASPISKLAWAPDDRHLAVGCESGRLAVLTVG